MKLDNYVKFYLIFFVILVGLFIGWSSINFYDKNNLPTNLSESVEREAEMGFLHSVTHKNSGNKYMLVSDQKIEDEDWGANVFVVDYLDSDPIWNPTICSQMPTEIDEYGNITTLESVFDGAKFTHRIIFFDSTSKTKRVTILKENQVGDKIQSQAKIVNGVPTASMLDRRVFSNGSKEYFDSMGENKYGITMGNQDFVFTNKSSSSLYIIDSY